LTWQVPESTNEAYETGVETFKSVASGVKTPEEIKGLAAGLKPRPPVLQQPTKLAG
jgi:hypothetical protein